MPVNADTFPLCEGCLKSLIHSPSLCQHCGGIGCDQDLESPRCLRPWISQDNIDSFHALYLCAGPGYRVLRRWKMSHGPVFDRQVLKSCNALANLPRHLDTIVPMPQRVSRAWRLGGSPALKISHWLKNQLNLPLCEALQPRLDDSRKTLRQAELGMRERLKAKISFAYDEKAGLAPGAKVLLVDDFMTSGHTLRAAAQELRSRGAAEVHVFCLGIRPRELRGKSQSQADLLERA